MSGMIFCECPECGSEAIYSADRRPKIGFICAHCTQRGIVVMMSERPAEPGETAETMPVQDFHEVWWIFSPADAPWAGLRIAHFRKSLDGTVVVMITSEPPHRNGVRIWKDIKRREAWYRVTQIAIPGHAQVLDAIGKGHSDDD